MIHKISKIIREKNILSLITSTTSAALGVVIMMLLNRGISVEELSSWAIYLVAATFFDMLRFGLTNTALYQIHSRA